MGKYKVLWYSEHVTSTDLFGKTQYLEPLEPMEDGKRVILTIVIFGEFITALLASKEPLPAYTSPSGRIKHSHNEVLLSPIPSPFSSRSQ